MIEREITPHLLRSFEQYPFVTVTGTRQAGKTTLCRAVFADLGYADLEDPRVRHHAESDPWEFLSGFPEGAVLDEVHHVPELLSCLKVHADEVRRNTLFVLTGSEQFGLIDNVTESLAGRTAMLRLLPFTLAERRRAGAGGRIDDIVYSGCYPRIHDQDLNPTEALGDYFASYVERDARRIGSIRNLDAFGRFARLCARRIGRQVNLRWLAAGAGVSPETARRWLDVLWVSDIVFTLSPTLAFPPFPATSRWSWIRRRRARSRRLYFCDVGLASYLLGIEDPGQLAAHPLRAALFENLVVAETLKHAFNQGHGDFPSEVSYYRGAGGVECRLLYGRGQRIGAIEMTLDATVSPDWFDSLTRIYEPGPCRGSPPGPSSTAAPKVSNTTAARRCPPPGSPNCCGASTASISSRDRHRRRSRPSVASARKVAGWLQNSPGAPNSARLCGSRTARTPGAYWVSNKSECLRRVSGVRALSE